MKRLSELVRTVDDKLNFIFEHDGFLMSFQVFKFYTTTIMFLYI